MEKIALAEVVAVAFHAIAHFPIDCLGIVDGAHHHWTGGAGGFDNHVSDAEELVAQPRQFDLHAGDVADFEFGGLVAH